MRSLATLLLAATALLAGCERPPVKMVQHGYRGTGMDQVYNPRTLATQAALNTAPEAIPAVPADGPKASETFKNVKVLGDLSAGQFTRLMVSITQWVAPPDQGCNYCHNPNDLADDSVYAKVVARRMIQMTQHINADWKPHVAETGVTCYTCHRGQPVPAQVWFQPAPGKKGSDFAGWRAGQNVPSMKVGLTSLPVDPFSTYLVGDAPIRVAGTQALPAGKGGSIAATERTYGLMMHMSQGLGVNCTYCHNAQNFGNWAESTPQRVTAWHGIRMVRDINNAYLVPLKDTYPKSRLGAAGDPPKANCATCHQGAYKPLYGAPMAKDFAELQGVKVSVVGAGLPPTEGSANGAILYFAVGSADLAGDAVPGMAQLVASLKANASAQAVISGFHSASGDAAANEELAKRRAFAVRDALKAAGIDEARVVLEKPQVTAGNDAGEDPKARRVEVAMK